VNYDPCLVCDNCVQNKRKAEELKLRAKYETQIFSLLDQSTEFDVNGLVNAIAPENKNVLTTLVAELVDHGVLKFDEFGKLEKGRKNT